MEPWTRDYFSDGPRQIDTPNKWTNYEDNCYTKYMYIILWHLGNRSSYVVYIFSAIWKVVSSFLNTDQKAKILQIGKSKIKNYLPDDNLWDHMK